MKAAITRKVPALVGTLLLLGASACKKEAPPAEQAPPPAPAPAAPAPAAPAPVAAPAPAAPPPVEDSVVSFSADPHQHMKEHFVRAIKMQDAVLAGNLADAQGQGRWLAGHKEETPDSWKPHVEAFQTQAAAVANAKTIDEAAAAVAHMAASCGACHAALHAKPKIGSAPIIGEAGTVKEHMAAQLEALDRLWDGLIIPSPQAWREGAKLLAKVAVPQKSLENEGLDKADSATLLADSLRHLSASAAKATKADRVTTYAELLTTCVACHVSVRNPIKTVAAPGAEPAPPAPGTK